MLSAPAPVSVLAGETVKVAFTAVDCADRPLTIVGVKLPAGATVVNSIDTELHVAKAVVTWAVPANTKAQKVALIVKAVATDSSSKTASSAPQTAIVKVLPAIQAKIIIRDAFVDSNILATARFNTTTGKLEVSGQVIWSKTSTPAQRSLIIRSETVVVSDATNGAYLGTAVVDNNGNWKAAIASNKGFAPCTVDAAFHGKVDVKDVNGSSNCGN